MTARSVQCQLALSEPSGHDLLPRILPGPVVVARTGHADQTGQRPKVAAESLTHHTDRWGPRPHGGPWLLETATSARLSGFGGAHFPAAAKWRAALARRKPITLVANAAEGEPLSAKDATLLRLRPHLVLDGLAILAETLHAVSVLLWIHEDDTTAREAVVEALRDRRLTGLDDPSVSIRPAAARYLSGESSAIKHALDGGPTLPTFQAPNRSARSENPVVVHNVETLAHVARLSRLHDPRQDAACPSGGPASRLLTILTPHDRRVVEHPLHLSLGEATSTACDIPVPETAAVLLGGYGGMWARWSEVATLAVDESVARRHGITLGAGIVAPLSAGSCGVAITAAITHYLARASAGQCGPCLFGLPALAASLDRLARGHVRRGDMSQLHADLAAIDGRGACHHPDGAVRLVRSALSVFDDDVAAHAGGSPCAGSRTTIPIPST
jgi:NADH:ubiquinone oxidoreductase subunit F (NADH-binding)